jgi:hypothetical protein
VAGVIGAISTVWFTIGGTNDLRRLFKDVAVKRQSIADDGRVIGHVSADDLQLTQKVRVNGLPGVHDAALPSGASRVDTTDEKTSSQ